MFYVYGMTTIFVTAIPLSLLGEFNPFLFVIAIFSFYLAFSGYRQGRDRNGAREQIDKALGIFITGTSILFYGLAISAYLVGDSMWITSVIFGTIALVFGINDSRRMKIVERPDFYDRTNLHLNLMLGGTIATTTAFIVTIDPFSILWLNWVAPTIVGTPIIIYFSRRELAKKAT
jgi:cytochrome c biogenesis protein CcdA